MKKTVLFLFTTLVAINFLSAQNAPVVGLKTNFNLKKLPAERLDLHKAKTGNEPAPSVSNPFLNPISTRTAGATPGSIVIGTTLYDLQTNTAVSRRLLQRTDGSMTAVWIISQKSDFSDRGTGYAYFDGTNWTCTNPETRLE